MAPVIVPTAVASIATVVLPSRAFNSAAATEASSTVTVSALFAFASVSVFNVGMSVSVTVAFTTPVVSASRIFTCATDAVPLFTVAP